MDFIYLATALALGGAWLIITGLVNLVHLYLLGGFSRITFGALLACAGLLLISIAINLNSYGQFRPNEPIAYLSFSQLGPQHYQAQLRLMNTSETEEDANLIKMELKGDEWQLDARLLKWHAFANLVGIRAYYKLDRISGRYQSIEQAQSAPRTVTALSEEPGMDIWNWLKANPRWMPWVEARYGNAVFLPMADGASFTIHVGADGLLAKAANPEAEAVISQW